MHKMQDKQPNCFQAWTFRLQQKGTIIDSKFPLNKAEDAWAKSIDGHATGKIFVEQ